MKPFDVFYKDIGFDLYPFSSWSSEQEKKYRKDIFIKPNYYGPIEEKFRDGLGMILVGERGSGKTASLYDLSRSVEKEWILIDVNDFTDIAISYSETEIYKLIISSASEEILKKVLENPKKIKKLDDKDKILLSYLYENFTSITTKSEIKRVIEKIQNSPTKRFNYFIYGIIKKPANLFLTASQNFVSELISNAIGAHNSKLDLSKIKEYFPDIFLKQDSNYVNVKNSIYTLKKISELINKIGYTRLIIMIDKLDEDSRLGGDAEKISDFIKGILQETKLHISDSVQIITSIWKIPYDMVKNKYNIRTQKMNVEHIMWEINDLENALNKRMGYFSGEKINNYRYIFDKNVDDILYKKIFSLSNKNPRDLWHLFDRIIRKQYSINNNSTKITSQAINDGILDFVKTFDYFEYYPRKEGVRDNAMDVYSYIHHLLRVKSVKFTRNQLSTKSGVSGGSANNYVSGMEKIGLISSIGQENGSIMYEVQDPKVIFAIENDIDISKVS